MLSTTSFLPVFCNFKEKEIWNVKILEMLNLASLIPQPIQVLRVFSFFSGDSINDLSCENKSKTGLYHKSLGIPVYVSFLPQGPISEAKNMRHRVTLPWRPSSFQWAVTGGITTGIFVFHSFWSIMLCLSWSLWLVTCLSFSHPHTGKKGLMKQRFENVLPFVFHSYFLISFDASLANVLYIKTE